MSDKIESMEKKRQNYIKKIMKIENDVRLMKKWEKEPSWIRKANEKWLAKARVILEDLENNIKLERMKAQ